MALWNVVYRGKRCFLYRNNYKVDRPSVLLGRWLGDSSPAIVWGNKWFSVFVSSWLHKLCPPRFPVWGEGKAIAACKIPLIIMDFLFIYFPPFSPNPPLRIPLLNLAARVQACNPKSENLCSWLHAKEKPGNRLITEESSRLRGRYFALRASDHIWTWLCFWSVNCFTTVGERGRREGGETRWDLLSSFAPGKVKRLATSSAGAEKLGEPPWSFKLTSGSWGSRGRRPTLLFYFYFFLCVTLASVIFYAKAPRTRNGAPLRGLHWLPLSRASCTSTQVRSPWRLLPSAEHRPQPVHSASRPVAPLLQGSNFLKSY